MLVKTNVLKKNLVHQEKGLKEVLGLNPPWFSGTILVAYVCMYLLHSTFFHLNGFISSVGMSKSHARKGSYTVERINLTFQEASTNV